MKDDVAPDGAEHSTTRNSHRRRGSLVWILLGVAGFAVSVGCARAFGVGRARTDFESRMPDRRSLTSEEDESGVESQRSSPPSRDLPTIACDKESDPLPSEVVVSMETESLDCDASASIVEEISSGDVVPHIENLRDDASPGLFVDPLAMRDRRGSLRR